MGPIVGIICEYDPFHRGHAHQFALIRRQWPDASILCLMSGCFTQRGMPAVHPPRQRALAALQAGADAVLELPCAFAVRDGEHFALGGVELLTRLGFVTHLCFGAEDPVHTLLPAAGLLESPTPAFTAALREGLEHGLSFAAAQGRALERCLGGDAWQKPNNILALCYLRAIARLHSPLIPFAVSRRGDYHAIPGPPLRLYAQRFFRAGRKKRTRPAATPCPGSRYANRTRWTRCCSTSCVRPVSAIWPPCRTAPKAWNSGCGTALGKPPPAKSCFCCSKPGATPLPG